MTTWVYVVEINMSRGTKEWELLAFPGCTRWTPVKKNTQIHPCRPFRKISRLNSLFFFSKKRRLEEHKVLYSKLKRSNCKSQIEIDGLFVT